MTALTTKRPNKEERWTHHRFPLAVGKKAFGGGAACIDLTAGNIVPAAGGAGLLYIGIFNEDVDATSVTKLVSVNLIDEIGIFWFANGTSTDAVAAANLGQECYFADDATVGLLGSTAGVARSLAGRIWGVDTTKGVAVQKSGGGNSAVSPAPALPAYVSNEAIPADIVSGGLYDIPTTAAATTITLPAVARDGTVARFTADGTKNGHTVTYRDATGPTALTTALTASKRHLVVVAKLGGKWFANAYVSP